jgi:hypothetical protein
MDRFRNGRIANSRLGEIVETARIEKEVNLVEAGWDG